MPAGVSGGLTWACRLLLEQDPTRQAAWRPSSTASTCERQTIEQQTLAEAEAEAMAALGVEEKGAVVRHRRTRLASGPWFGLVAARLKEHYGRPAFAIALEPGGIGTGSGRSIQGVDLGAAVRHAVAAGLLPRAAATRWRRHHDQPGQSSRRSAPIWRRRCMAPSRSRGAKTRC